MAQPKTRAYMPLFTMRMDLDRQTGIGNSNLRHLPESHSWVGGVTHQLVTGLRSG